LFLKTPMGPQMVPALAITEQFDRASRECQDPKKVAAWIPMLSQYGPHLLVACENATKLSKELVAQWLFQYMFKSESLSEKPSCRKVLSLPK
jgi:hypothetical protein